MARTRNRSSGNRTQRPDATNHRVSISFPQLQIDRLAFGRNFVLQVGEAESRTNIEASEVEPTVFKAVSPSGVETYLYKQRSRVPIGDRSRVLRMRDSVDSPSTLTTSTRFAWEAHPHLLWPKRPSEIVQTWADSFRFIEEDVQSETSGLRTPQIGALHAIAAHWTVSDAPATIVMPTGTGKTETMLATLVYCRCSLVLLIVPSDTLRTQLFRKFITLGCLRDAGVISLDTAFPRVAFIRSGIRTAEEARTIASESNVMIATPSSLSASAPEALDTLATQSTHLFVDEAHHLPAPSWTRIKDRFLGKRVLQFTATPFRNDEQRIDGRIIYNYPLSHAQRAGFFRPIELLTVEELDDARSDRAIALEAVQRLRNDLSDGLDHIILARAKGITRAQDVLAVYEGLGQEFQPVLIHSTMPHSQKAVRVRQLESRESRILVCVDMFGEGFDLPQLKIAAMHDIHKSLPITLQFVGRFVRTAQDVGGASVVVNMADPRVDRELQSLYSEDPDWNLLLQRTSERRIAREMSLQQYVDSFSGDLPQQLPLWNLRPGYSTVVYRTSGQTWVPESLKDSLPRNVQYWHAINADERVTIAVVAKQEDVRWGRFRNIKDHYWNLVIAHAWHERNLLFIYASDYNVVNLLQVARGLCGQDVALLNGGDVFRVFSGIERPMVKNLGASKTGTISFTMYFGPEVSVGLSQVERAESDLNNLFGWGYEDGEIVTRGCSSRKGKVWSTSGGVVMDWQAWCQNIGDKLLDQTVDEVEVIRGFLRPESMAARTQAVPVAIEWGERVIREEEDRVFVFIDNREYRLNEVTIAIDSPSETGPINFEIRTDDKVATYALQIGAIPNTQRAYEYQRIGASSVDIRLGSGLRMPLPDWCDGDPFIIYYADGSFSYNQYLVSAPCVAAFDVRTIDAHDWTGVDIRTESEGPNRDMRSIQYHMIESIRDDFEVIFNDDGAGEAADIVALRRDGEDAITLRFVHCKYSSEGQPGARIDDMYQLCGQAQKSVRWKHRGLASLVKHMKSREMKWQGNGHTRFAKGTLLELRAIEKAARRVKLRFEISIVQPGLAKSRVSDGILELLGTTELLLKKMAVANFTVLSSE